MPEPQKHVIDAERLRDSLRAWRAAFPEFADLVARTEARLLAGRDMESPSHSCANLVPQPRTNVRKPV